MKADEETIGSGRSGNAKKPSNFIGRHRLQAALSHLDQQINIFQEELNELDSVGGPSTVCNELITGVESTPDPLLPETRGPVDVSWERWFGGGNTSRTHRRWI
ncbi:guanine nucleotide-binding protein subunit gamma 2-like isoform X1 [Silene latifolia]|uniref:guanine nucleotide-binding protein subunit gamma 2-like isoform X1 n=1 Tax=Silene latifolia TaxID=37657 RepID=UPI003D7751D6